MSAEAITVRAFLGDGERAFALTDDMVLELERITGQGIGRTFADMTAMRFAFPHVAETIRLALIGGGTSPAEAMRLSDTWVRNRPLAETFPVALAILEARWNGAEPEPEPEAPAPAAEAPQQDPAA